MIGKAKHKKTEDFERKFLPAFITIFRVIKSDKNLKEARKAIHKMKNLVKVLKEK